MKLRYAIYGILLTSVFVFAIWKQMTPSDGQKDFLRTMQEIKSLKKIIIQPYPSSREKWEIVVTNVPDLVEVQSAIHQADLKPVSGHSGEILESYMTFLASDGQVIKTRATVHKYEPQDLYLSPDLFQQSTSGVLVAAGAPDRVRVPTLGNWIIRKVKSDK